MILTLKRKVDNNPSQATVVGSYPLSALQSQCKRFGNRFRLENEKCRTGDKLAYSKSLTPGSG